MGLSTWINGSNPNSIKLIKEPFPHAIINNFLKKEKAIAILKALKKEEFHIKESDLFTFFQTHDFKNTKNKVIHHFRDFLTSGEFLKYLSNITQLHLEKDNFDMFGTIYQNTNYLLPHDDRLETRKVAYIYYLNTLKKHEGGSLSLYQSKKGKPTKITKRVQPEFNTFAFFIVSKNSFHEVQEVVIDKQRIAITGWFH